VGNSTKQRKAKIDATTSDVSVTAAPRVNMNALPKKTDGLE
jgi:hypothetical protein